MKIQSIGEKFNLITIVSYSHIDTDHRAVYVCRCDCGKIFNAKLTYVKRNKVKSCGCLIKTIFRKGQLKHGKRKHPLYGIWLNIRSRCNTESHRDYKHYGGRGINVCERWNNFELFLSDMGDRPTKKHSIDRINNDGNYCPENCKWSTTTEQSRNRRKYKNALPDITIDGETKSIKQWCKEKKINYTTALYRKSIGKTIEEIFST